ncbi:MAG: FHA domain-containing protein [Ardenticatenaceae bacterium]|nr:FHA domain-containing protein [Ardenticatenaceae bacterium]
MSGSQKRLELRVDVFEKTEQRALPLPNLTPPEFIEAILQEFRELEYLSDSPANYRLLKAADKSPLDTEEKLDQQLAKGDRLVLIEEETPLPHGTQRPTHPIYLREQVTGKVYKLHWQPAIIGRPDKNQALNDMVAVDLERYKTGLRVSRRHVQISEQDGQYFIHSMSRNPTFIKDEEGNMTPVTEEKRPLQNGDIIVLERSSIALKFIIRQ